MLRLIVAFVDGISIVYYAVSDQLVPPNDPTMQKDVQNELSNSHLIKDNRWKNLSEIICSTQNSVDPTVKDITD